MNFINKKFSKNIVMEHNIEIDLWMLNAFSAPFISPKPNRLPRTKYSGSLIKNIIEKRHITIVGQRVMYLENNR